MTDKVICLGTAQSPGLGRMELPTPDRPGVVKLRKETQHLNIIISADSDSSELVWWIMPKPFLSHGQYVELIQIIERVFQAKCQYHFHGKPLTQDQWIAYMRGTS